MSERAQTGNVQTSDVQTGDVQAGWRPTLSVVVVIVSITHRRALRRGPSQRVPGGARAAGRRAADGDHRAVPSARGWDRRRTGALP